jgi:hypothetical protein
MKNHTIAFLSITWLMAMPGLTLGAQECIECHLETTPQIVSDWELSKHNQADGPNCIECHGSAHTSADDVAKVKLATPSTCASCHEEKVEQFKAGKHAKAWVAMNAMPTSHWQPMALMEGMKGCGGCHKIGIKSEEEMKKLKEQGQGFGNASCDACHTRHLFSSEEARQPQTCRTCHMGIDHPQWEMYSSSKHGVRYKLKQLKVLPEGSAAPTCQTCHLQDGNHAVRTAWGFLAVRLPMPDDTQWASDRATFLKGLGVLDPEGNPTARLDVVKAGDVARLTQDDWEQEREKMLKACNSCHSGNFARLELEKGDQMIREADRLMAEGITLVAELYENGLIDKPESYAYPFPDLLTFHDAPTEIEQKLFLMFLEYRMRTFQGIFHANPDYAFWYGWSEMKMTLTEIKRLAADMKAGQ